MICIIAFIISGILGVFSIKYRIIAKEALNCIFKKITLKKCDTGLDQRLKGEITGKLFKVNPKIGRFVYKYFEWFSWVFLILTVVTLFFVGQGLYFYLVYGNCNGPNSDKFCIFDPLETNKLSGKGTSEICNVPGMNQNITLTPPPISKIIELNNNLNNNIYKGNPNAKVIIIEFGCYSCYYTKLVEPTVKKIIDKYKDEILFLYLDFPLSNTHNNALLASKAAYCALEQEKYWEYRNYLFANQPKQYYDDLLEYAKELNLSEEKFKECLKGEKYEKLVNQTYQLGLESGVVVTPTFFINNKTIIGAKNLKEFEKIIDKELGLNFWNKLFR